ncbi:MAG: ABC transporter ATP-binding protein [Candidatus Porifericomitaceae bacterium WSBS_2022_MAG_OTU9]
MKEQNADALVRLHDISFYRGSRTILDNIDVSIEKGKLTAIMGPSGCGKTTLLRLIGGQLLPDKGTVLVDGLNVPELGRRQLMALRRRMGLLFQSGALLSDLSVYDNVAFPLRENTSLPESIIRDLVLLKLEAVGLRGAVNLAPSELSGGMARRVALARAVVMDPMLIMYDEPFAGQDPISMGVLARLVKTMNKELGLTSIVVSHDIHETCDIADYIYVLAEGQIKGQGDPETLLRSEHPWLQQFFNAKADGPVSFHYPAPDLATELMS